MALKKELMINTKWCKGCGICVAFCPKGVLELHEEKVRVKEGAVCVFCGLCELRCPDYAIYIDEKQGGTEQWAK
jgi:2-oxoglutarate ferredoxin oxidoreductase subunit delta